MQTLLLVGGGHAHLAVLESLAQIPIAGVRVVLLSADSHLVYSGMLPGVISGQYSASDGRIDLQRLGESAGATFVRARATTLDLARRQVRTHDGRTVAFDVLSLDVGARGGEASQRTNLDFVVPVKPVGQLLAIWQRVLEGRAAPARRSIRLAVVGGAAAGIELALAMRRRLRRTIQSRVSEVLLVADELAPSLPARGRRLLARALEEAGVSVLRRRRVTRLAPGRLHCASGETVRADLVVWATGAVSPDWIAGSGLRTDAHGFVEVDDTLRSSSHPFVFAAGDVASLRDRSLPKAGVFAVRQGPVLARNLRRCLTGRPLLRYRPQRAWLSLISTGDGGAIGTYGPLAWQGRWVWRWKDRIDRAFVGRFGAAGVHASDVAPLSDPSANPAGQLRRKHA